MVSYKQVQASNSLLRSATQSRVAVFVGGTSGVGKYTIKALVGTGTTSKIYLVGRKSSAPRMHAFIQDMKAISDKAEIIWTEAEVSLLSETQRVCKDIVSKEKQVDLLFMSAGYAPFSGRNETAEGLEITQSLEYYSRMLCIFHLLPLLKKAESPRVISVLAGGLEPASIELDDMDLKKPANFGGFTSQGHYAAMNTMTLEKLAGIHPHITFVHSFPGWVSTGNHLRGRDQNSLADRLLGPIANPLISLLSCSEEETGQRHLFECTSAAFGGRGTSWDGPLSLNSLEKRGNGLFLLNKNCESTKNAKALISLREKAQEKIWEHTQKILQGYF